MNTCEFCHKDGEYNELVPVMHKFGPNSSPVQVLVHRSCRWKRLAPRIAAVAAAVLLVALYMFR